MKYITRLFCILIIGCSTSGRLPDTQIEEYAYLSSLFLLDTDTDAVVRDYDMSLHISDETQGLMQVRKAVTILNKDAREKGFLAIGYDKFREIESVSAALYDNKGQYIRSLQSNDINDYSATSSYSLYEDNRVRTYQLYHNQYPYTVVYDYSIKFNSLLNLPTWQPQGKNEFVERASLTVESPTGMEIRHKAFNLETGPEKKYQNGNSVLVWEAEKLSPVVREPLAPSFKELIPKVMVAVNTFTMEGSKGSMESWSSFGKWYYDLSKGRNTLPLSVQRQVRNISDNARTEKETVKQLYKYMQQKTRYISVQLGIGGWRPFDATYVEERGYGDCKALTNYMQSLLTYADIESYPVLIRNGISEPDIITDFPSNQFNHVVLYVPVDGEEAVWLENTSQFTPFNHIGFSNANRQGLVVKEDTAHLIKTPSYDYTINRQDSKTEIRLDSGGNAELKISNTVSGFYLDRLIAELAGKSEPDRRKWLHSSIPLNTFKVLSTDFTEIDQKKQKPVIRYWLENRAYGTQTGARVFVPVNKLNRWTTALSKSAAQREQRVSLKATFSEIDETVIYVPDGYMVEALPDNIELEVDFARYSLQIELSDSNEIEIKRSLVIYKKELSAEHYSELESFTAKVLASDQQVIILKKSQV